MDFAYMRVSTKKQSFDLQIDAFIDKGIKQDNIYKDIASGAKSKRTGLEKLLNTVRFGDNIYIWKLDRIARSLSHFNYITHILEKKGVGLISLTEPFLNTSKTNPHSKFIVNIFSSIAELEKDLIKERVREGLNSARRKNIKLGRKKGSKPETIKCFHKAKNLYNTSNLLSVNEICKICNISKPTFYKLLNAENGK